jgi:hypothetical protein
MMREMDTGLLLIGQTARKPRIATNFSGFVPNLPGVSNQGKRTSHIVTAGASAHLSPLI